MSRAMVRAVPWQPVPAAAAVAALLLGWQHDRLAEPAGAVWMLRVVAVLLAAALAFASDDRTRATLAAVPTPLWWRTVARLLVVGLPAVVVWAVAVAWVAAQAGEQIPVGGLSLEAGALGLIAVAVAGGLARWRDLPDSGMVTAPAILGLGLLLPQLPEQIALAVVPGPAWGDAHARWALLLLAAALVLAATLADPGGRLRSRAWVPPSR